jgi:hypothetical protein
LPLGRNVKLEALDRAIQVPPEKLIAFIESQGLKVYLYPSRRPRNPQFQTGKMVSATLGAEGSLKDLFEDSGTGATITDAGIFFPREDVDLGKYGTAIVIAESATAHTLLHEFTHYLFYKTEFPRDLEVKYGLVDRAVIAQRTLTLQYSYSFLDLPASNRYKRDSLVDNLTTALKIEGERVQWFVSEEVIIEAILANKIVSTSNYYDQARLEKGLRYAKSNIKKSRIDLAQGALMFHEMTQGFMTIAGAYPGTSIAEREEIVTTIPAYRDAVERTIDEVNKSLDALEAMITNPS